jgi:hypothetical protein
MVEMGSVSAHAVALATQRHADQHVAFNPSDVEGVHVPETRTQRLPQKYMASP